MLIKVTNRCGMGCSHCLEKSVPSEPHMDLDTFDRALEFTWRIERLARERFGYALVLLSGGECTEHPDIVTLIERTISRGFTPMLISNGTFLENETLKKELLHPRFEKVLIQITNDKRFYPRSVPRVDHPRLLYVDSLTATVQLGRFKGKTSDLPGRSSPSSFNFRSLTRSLQSSEEALAMIRGRAMTGMSGHCSPSVSHDGSFVAGESRLCFQLGTVDSTPEQVTKTLLEMGSCNRCSTEAKLGPEHRRAIGLMPFVVPGSP